MSKLRYAILGSGMMGHEHIRNIHLLEETEVSAVSDPDEGMREKAVSLTDGRAKAFTCLLYTSPSPRDGLLSRMPSSA